LRRYQQATFHTPATHRQSLVPQRAALIPFVLLALLLSGCDLSFGRSAAATPEPFTPPTYEPGFATPAPRADETPLRNAPVAPNTTAAVAAAPVAPAATSPWVYTGEIEPEDEITIVTEVGGHILRADVEIGDRVTAGQPLFQIESATLEAQRAQALAALQAAQAQVELLNTPAKETDIEAARSAVAAADAAYKRALEGPTPEDLIMAESQLRQAEAALLRAQAAYDLVSWNPLIAALPESQQLQQATLALEAAQAQYDKLVKGATADVIAGAYAQLASAQAQLRRLEDGAQDAQIQAAEAQVRQAETALYLAQLQLDKAIVRAPVNGIIAQVHLTVGSMALPGSPAARLLSPEVKIVIPVEESRMAQVSVGQPARIRVNAFPDRIFEGTVAIIAPQLDPATRTVRVTVRPSGDAHLLTPGMFAAVELLQP
jgi:HlyD family secretion protein